jgi:hypothetical protein
MLDTPQVVMVASIGPPGGGCRSVAGRRRRLDRAPRAGFRGQPSKGRQRRGRLISGRQFGQESGSCLRHKSDRSRHRLLRTRRDRLHTADLAHVLEGGGLNLFGGGFRFQASERGDISAHRRQGYAGLVVPGAPMPGRASVQGSCLVPFGSRACNLSQATRQALH